MSPYSSNASSRVTACRKRDTLNEEHTFNNLEPKVVKFSYTNIVGSEHEKLPNLTIENLMFLNLQLQA
jgi:hypothetical protein